MKKILQITIFLTSIGIYACMCDEPKLTEKYIQSDFVAKAKIIKNHENKEGSGELYKADIEILELYKGNTMNSVYVAGRSDGNMGSSCAIFIPEDTELIIYARKNNEGKYIIGMCSGLLYLNNRNVKRQSRELNILRLFKAKQIDLTDKIKYREKGILQKNLEQFKGIKLEKEYGIYELTFTPDLNIQNVKEISGFGNSIDEKLIEIISKTEWTSFDKGTKDKVPDNSKLLIAIYYYEQEIENSGFLSQW